MIKVIGLAKRKAGMSREDFIEYYNTRHAKNLGEPAMRACGGVRYCRRFVQPLSHPATGAAAHDDFDVVVEFWFKDEAGMKRALSYMDGEMKEEFLADERNFLDLSSLRALIVTQEDESEM